MFKRSTNLDVLLHRSQPSAWSQFLAHPTLFLARRVYGYHLSLTEHAPGRGSGVTVVCISDTHNYQPHLVDGDILIHAGDLTQSGSLKEVQATIDWLNSQPHAHKVVIAGNHDLILDTNYRYYPSSHPEAFHRKESVNWGDVTYLQNSSVTLRCSHDRELKIYGSPFSLRHGNWAFQYPRTTNIWDEHSIPADADILITHGPPQGHLDLDRFGCKFLLERLWKLQKEPQLHVFGHVHGGYGVENALFDDVQRAYDDAIISNGGLLRLLWLFYVFLSSILCFQRISSTWFVNAAMVGGLRDEKRRPPITINI